MGRNWAITIGINGYRYLQRLNFAKRDTDSARQFFIQEMGFQQVYHFTDDSPPFSQAAWTSSVLPIQASHRQQFI